MGQDPSDDDLSALDAESSELARRTGRRPADPAAFDQLAKERDRLADERDQAADARDAAALARRREAAERDVEASARDRLSRQAHDDIDPGFPDRFLSARDVDASAGDRADELTDERHAGENRRHAREDRQQAAEDRARAAEAAERAEDEAAHLRIGMEQRTVIGQAQGLLMARLGVSADEAFQLLVRESQARNVKLREVARQMVEDAGQA